MKILSLILTIIVLLIIYPEIASGECTKKVKAQEYIVRSHPNPFIKVENPKIKGEIKEILVKCELYETLEIGDFLESTEVERLRLFNKDKGYIERKQWEVLKK